MDAENLIYAAIQVAHNFGAAAVVGAPLFARWPVPLEPTAQRRLAWLVLAGWLVQMASGAGFGVASLAAYGQLPDIHGIAVAALLIKIGCAAVGVVLAVVVLGRGRSLPDTPRRRLWAGLLALGAVALTAAAFLRWFS